MATVSQEFLGRWLSGDHLAGAKPWALVKVRRAHFVRGYTPWPGPEINAHFPGLDGHPWHPTWRKMDGGVLADSDYQNIPGVREINLEQSFDESGSTVATITIDNIFYQEASGMAGIYHLINRGALSPWRGIPVASRPQIFTEDGNWSRILLPNSQITLSCGYGADTAVKTFTGLINSVDWTSSPDEIVVTARDFGQVLTDSRLFIQNKDPRIQDPVVFSDRSSADRVFQVSGVAKASSSHPSFPPRFGVDEKVDSFWASQEKGTPNDVEWFQVTVPRGRYESVGFRPVWSGMEAWISVFARPGPSGGFFVNGQKIPTVDGGWVNMGLGTVPGSEDGGYPYMAYINNTNDEYNRIPLGATLEVGDDTTFRVALRKLHKVSRTTYQAGVRTLAPIKRVLSTEARERHWVLVDDAADVVRVVLRWAGFKEWDVENTGVRLKGKTTVGRDKSYMEVIRQICDLTGFTFFMADPSSADGSLGIPTFRRSGAIVDRGTQMEVRSDQLLTGIQVRTTDEPLATIIRVRGREARPDTNEPFSGGRVLGADRTRRIMDVYRPPWHDVRLQVVSSAETRLASIIKHTNINMPELQTLAECRAATRLIALQQALESTTAQIEVPGNPMFQLDDRVNVVDRGTGINTRMWLASRSTSITLGEDATWMTTLGGSLLDTVDIQAVLRDINAG